MSRFLPTSFTAIVVLSLALLFMPPRESFGQEPYERWLESHCVGCNRINDLAWNPDGSLLAVADDNGVALYDADFERVAQLTDARTQYLSWNFNGTLLASSPIGSLTPPGKIAVWDVAQRQLVTELETEHTWYINLDWSPLENVLAYSTGFGLNLWDADRDALESVLPLTQPPLSASAIYAPSFQAGSLWRIVWSPDGRWIAVSTRMEGVYIWDRRENTVVATFDYGVRPLQTLEWGADSRHLIVIDEPEAFILDAMEGSSTTIDLEARVTDQTTAKWSPDGTLVAGSVRINNEYAVWLWDSEEWGHQTSLRRGHIAEITALAWSPDGERIASGSEDGTVRIWERCFEQAEGFVC